VTKQKYTDLHNKKKVARPTETPSLLLLMWNEF